MTDTEMLNHNEDEKLQRKTINDTQKYKKIVTAFWHIYPRKPVSPFTTTENERN